MESLTSQQSTPLTNVTDLGEALIGKLSEAGISTVEALADMTPEQLEEVPGVGPKTVEKISIAVNNYFSTLETGVVAPIPEAGETAAVEGAEVAEPVAEIAAADSNCRSGKRTRCRRGRSAYAWRRSARGCGPGRTGTGKAG